MIAIPSQLTILPWKQQIRFSPKVFDIHCEVLISAVK